MLLLPPELRLYFAYGSNLWLTQMAQRCETAEFMGVGHLAGYQWHINERGVANVFDTTAATATKTTTTTAGGDLASAFPSSNASSSMNQVDTSNGVYGFLYLMTPEAIQALDGFEGVPDVYEQRTVQVTVTSETGDIDKDQNSSAGEDATKAGHDEKGAATGVAPPDKTTQSPAGTPIEAFMYIDVKRTTAGQPREEYIQRMNHAIDDARAKGIPAQYIDTVLRRFIPALDT